ncbi:uncharacterized protein MONBRDRAFT_27775 [Monosiga brevicollis MX1]|uniref:PiggyBac transposable element-derived protein domain-containing protein n=1 Tax=Monosiga brevicollis TaxID=81824 RepID=A9V6A0_MONBE|nr:uncharacterized protein MONBRDRAFT_27775 [Monosiga brevicollis MX1]EDQ87032.1 predicted protein [Monosiga brevicollis MX1]|eukprot:XP_001748271.1 hypothetical protein [Monosiga brevicollis MX1]
MPVHPPGTVVSARKRFLLPRDLADTLPVSENDVVTDLTVVGRGVHRGRLMYRLRHESLDDTLFTGMVAFQRAIITPGVEAVATGAAETTAEDAVEEADVEEVGDDYFEDLVDVQATAGAPTSTTAGDSSDFIEWTDLDAELDGSIDGDKRSSKRARMHVIDPRTCSPAGLFRALLPPDAIARMLAATTPHLESPLSADELMGFFGLMMRCADDARPRDDLWSVESRFYPNPPVSTIMSLQRFQEIADQLSLSLGEPDEVKAVEELIDSWNARMTQLFSPSSTMCLDKSSVRHPSATTPLFRLPSTKPNPTSQEYHNLCDAETRVIMRMELARGQDGSGPAAKDELDFGPLGALALRMTAPFNESGAVVVMDSTFCNLRAIVELRRRGLLAVTPIKQQQHQHWPQDLDGIEAAHAVAKQRPIGKLCVRHGTTKTQVPYPVAHFLVNYGQYVVQLVSTYGSTKLGRAQRKVRAGHNVIAFRRNEVMDDFYRACAAVDQHKELRQDFGHRLEEAWAPSKWTLRHLSHILSATMTNAFLIWSHFGNRTHVTCGQFRRMVAVELMEGEGARRDAQRRANREATGAVTVSHTLIKLMPYEAAAPGKRTKKKYQQQRCVGEGCPNLTRMYFAVESGRHLNSPTGTMASSRTALTINFILDAIVFVMLLNGHELGKEIITHGGWARQCAGREGTWPAFSNDACGAFVRGTAQFILIFGVMRLLAAMYPNERGVRLGAIISYLAEIFYFSFEMATGAISTAPEDHTLDMCMTPPYAGRLNTCALRTAVPAILICLSMLALIFSDRTRSPKSKSH